MLDAVLSSTPDFVYVFSLDHRVLYANDALIAMWGCGREGAIGKTFLEIGYEPWHADMHNREIDQVTRTRLPIRGEVPFNGTNGRRQYDYIFVPIIGPDGAVEAVAGTTRDVTERKETERQLRVRQDQLDFALAAADLGQWSLNLADRTTKRTLRHDQIFGYDSLVPAWTFQKFLEHVLPADRAAVEDDFQRAVDTGSAWFAECRIRRVDGAVRHIWMKGLVRTDAAGYADEMLGIVGDITERRQAEDRQALELRMSEALRPLDDPLAVQAVASKLLGEYLAAARVVYFEIRGNEYIVEQDYTAGVQSLAGRYPVAAFGQSLLTALLDGRTVVEADATTEPGRPPEEQAGFAAIQVRGHVDVPLVKSGR
ncbi:MAG: PAS domain-containing protein, partial [Armatimonadota bacterium]